MADALIAELGGEETSSFTVHDELVPWDPDKTPTQVQLVDLLQFHILRVNVRSPFRIAVIVSAWDLVCGENMSPEEWFAARLPLLDQYLKANHEMCAVRIYGVSAQGGDVEKDAESLQDEYNPSKRIIVVGKGCNANDLTAPIRWLMN